MHHFRWSQTAPEAASLRRVHLIPVRARCSTAPRSSCYTHHSARPWRDADVLAVRLSHSSQLPSYLLQDLGESAL